MKRIYLITFLFVLFSNVFVTAQQLPVFLKGTWKLTDKNTYEHWDLINDNQLKGFSYKVSNAQMEVTEYLEINKTGEGIIYTATVINQNQGAGIDFKLIKSDSLYSFENPAHDFPKLIQYKPVTENTINVTIGSNERSITLVFDRQD